MKRRNELSVQALFDGLAPEKAAEILPAGTAVPPEAADGVRARVFMRIRRAERRKRRGRVASAVAAAAAAILMLTVGAAAVDYHYRNIRVETPEEFTTSLGEGSTYSASEKQGWEIAEEEKPGTVVVSFERDASTENRKTDLYAIRAENFPCELEEDFTLPYLDFLAYRFRERGKGPEDPGIPLSPKELESRYGASLPELEGCYQYICSAELVDILDEEGVVIMGNTIRYNASVYSGRALQNSFVLTGTGETEETTFDGHPAVRVSLRKEENIYPGEDKYLLIYYEWEDTVVIVSKNVDYGEVSFAELEEIARGIRLVDTGVDASLMPDEVWPVNIVGTVG